MISLLTKIFIKDRENITSPTVRQAYGVLFGTLGIILNFMLFLGKLFAGMISGSIAITSDAFNNLSDAGSSIITLSGFKLAGQMPDPEHPFGHGRIEYISGLIVAMVILIMGFELLKGSISKIIHPRPVEFTAVSLAILLISIGVKIFINFYNRKIGKKIDSTAMKATAADSLNDCVATTTVLLAMLLIRFTGINIDGYAGVLVSLFIFWSGYNTLKDTVNPLLGQSPDPNIISQINDIVMSHPEALGVHDLIVHDYGPGRLMISLHVEVSGEEDAYKLHDAIDNIENELVEKLGCEAVIHMDPLVVNDELTINIKKYIREQIKENIDEKISIHDLRLVPGPTHTNVIFDVVIPHKFRISDAEVKNEIKQIVRNFDENYFAVVKIDKAF